MRSLQHESRLQFTPLDPRHLALTTPPHLTTYSRQESGMNSLTSQHLLSLVDKRYSSDAATMLFWTFHFQECLTPRK